MFNYGSYNFKDLTVFQMGFLLEGVISLNNLPALVMILAGEYIVGLNNTLEFSTIRVSSDSVDSCGGIFKFFELQSI
tara:strand:- start:187 stop:417 length:231 start_codon:yes stop_codon:yes gene_type:complete